MVRALLLLLLGLVVVPAAAGEKLLVANQSNNSAELIDLTTRKSLAVTAVGQQPLTAAVTPDRRYGMVAAVGYFAAPSANGDLVILDLNAAGLPAVVTVSANTRVYGVDVTPDSKLAVLCRENRQSVKEIVLIDLTTSPPSQLGSPVPIPGARSLYSVESTTDGRTAYVLDFQGATLSVVDLTQLPPVVVKQLSVIRSSIFMRLANDGRRLLIVSIASPGQAEIWNTETGVPVRVGSVAVGSNPGAIPSFEPGNQFCLVANAGSRDVHVIDAHAATPAVLGSVGAVGSDLRGVTATTDGLAGWAASRVANTLIEINLSNPASPTVTGRTLGVARGPNSLVAFGEVHAHGIPSVGSPYPIFFSSPGDAGKAYLLGASLATQPGIPIGARVIPLVPDLLFAISQTVPAVFQGFTGLLDVNGQAAATLNLPGAPALVGLSFYVAGVVIDPAAPLGIGTITNAEHLVLQ